MSEIPKAYEPQAVEKKWYDFWLKEKCFVADPRSPKPAYSIVIPPPNVTGVLHMGHVLNNTIQDILSRKARMEGKEVLWLPGTDHAGIATEGMVSKQIWKEEKKSKRDIGREEFIKRVWQWKEKHGGIIIEQLKKLGSSCDWTRERFTMDPEYVRCVQKVFVDLYKKGLIYRGKRMVNWCPATLTALSDEEVDMETQKASLYYFKVEVVNSTSSSSRGNEAQTHQSAIRNPKSEIDQSLLTSAATETAKQTFGPQTDSEGRTWLTIATTRPETIPGDTAVAVNPKDPRYAALVGKFVLRPLPAELPLEKKLIPIIADEYVDFEFGTGVLKVTPAHDKNDFEIGQRHKLAAVDIMNPNATMNDLAGADLAGMDRFEARAKATELLRDLGALVKEEPYENKIGFSQRARVPIEPRLSEQWFLKYPSIEKAHACVQQEGSAEERSAEHRSARTDDRNSRSDAPCSGQMHFHPQRWAKVYDHWMTNIQDWCISRQLWWGHRIPVWTRSQARVSDDKWQELPAELKEPGLEGETTLSKQQGHRSFVRFHTDEIGRRSETQVATFSEVEAQKLEKLGFTQDPDVLDTWCSSWLWPFATMGWTGNPEVDAKNETLKKFYPTTDLVTAPDIIFFWVARMIMAGYEFMGDLPFRNVYFTGIIRDKQGRKMSKTLGNSPDPLELIAKYGADALRFGTMRSAPLGQDVLFDEKDVELGRNFCNKLWNACRFRQLVGQASRLSPSDSESASKNETGGTPVLRYEVQGEINSSLLTSDDKWILLKLNQAIREITEAFAEYKFNEATQTLYRFFWSEFCDWYLEAAKASLSRVEPLNRDTVTSESDSTNQQFNDSTGNARRANTLAVIDFVLSHTLRLFHPFLPFITEELWHGMGYSEDMPESQGGKTIMFAPWPKPFDSDMRDHYSLDDCYLEFANAKYELVSQGRNLRREANIPANKKVRFVLKPANEVIPHDAAVLKILLNAEPFEINPDFQPAKGTPTVHSAMGDLFLPLEGLTDVEAEKARRKKELEKAAAEVAKVEEKLNNPAFTQKVPPQVLAEHQKRLAEWQAKKRRAEEALVALGN
jgi:valyl-tRNA synthetase